MPRPERSVRTARGSALTSALLHDQGVGKLTDPEFEGTTSNGWLATHATHLRLTGTNLLDDLGLLILQPFDSRG